MVRAWPDTGLDHEPASVHEPPLILTWRPWLVRVPLDTVAVEVMEAWTDPPVGIVREVDEAETVTERVEPTVT